MKKLTIKKVKTSLKPPSLTLTPKQRMRLYLLGTTILLPVLLILVFYVATRPNYNLTSTDLKLTGTVATNLTKNIKFNAKDQTYEINKSEVHKDKSGINVSVGQTSAGSNGYSLDAPTNISRGLTYYDDQTGLAFNMAPLLNAAKVKYENGRFVYPVKSKKMVAVYTPKENGLQEDLILNKFVSSSMSFSYKLNLPSTLAARQLGNGAIGIYSANAVLFSNMSYDNSADQQLVQKARSSNSDKNNLLFVLMPPFVKTANGNQSSSSTSLALKGNIVTLTAKGLNKMTYPLTIDPSVVSTGASFVDGNNEGGVNINTSTDSISTSTLSGGALSGNLATQSSNISTATSALGVAVYNGYIYEYGGNANGSLTNAVYYSSIASGSLANPSNGCSATNHWCSTTSFNTARSDFGAVAYNGYLYVIGGVAGSSAGDCTASGNYCNGVQYAPINSDGSTGSWNLSTNVIQTAARKDFGTVAYNGYLYVLGGYDGTNYYNDVQYAAINSDGSIGAFNNTANTFTTARSDLSAVAYNGYLYILGGYDGTSYHNDIQYAPICGGSDVGSTGCTSSSPAGSVGTWVTAASSFTTARKDFGAVAYNGYLYVLGGYNGSYLSDVQDAAINSNGSLGYWQASANLASAEASFGVVGYTNSSNSSSLYTVGGYNGSYSNVTASASISAPGTMSSFATNATLSTMPTLFGAAVSVYRGYIYVSGGCPVGETDKRVCDDTDLSQYIYSLAINSNGSVTYFADATFTQARYYAASVAANGWLYILGGCSGAPTVEANGICSSTNTTNQACVTYYQLVGGVPENDGNANGACGTKNLGYAAWGLSAAVYNNTIIAMGGCLSVTTGTGDLCDSLSNTTTYESIGSGGPLASTMSTGPNLSVPVVGAAATVYGNTLYLVGGCKTASSGTNYAGCEVDQAAVQYINLNNFNQGASCTKGIFAGASCSANATWSTTSSMSSAAWGLGAYADNGYLYALSGCSGNWSSGSLAYYGCIPTGLSSVIQRAPINSNGTLGAFTTAGLPTMPNPRFEFGSFSYDGIAYALTGCTGGVGSLSPGCGSANVLKTVIYAQVNIGGRGTNSAFSYNSGLAYAATQAAAVVSNGYIYLIGGTSEFGTDSDAVNTIQYAAINKDGTLGTWTSSSSTSNGNFLAPARYGQAATAYNGYIYMVGGSCLTNTGDCMPNGYSNGIQYAKVPTSGSGALVPSNCATSWCLTTTSMPIPRYNEAAVAYNGYLYVLGGNTYPSNSTYGCTTSFGGLYYCSGVEYIPIASNGNITGSWTNSSSLSNAVAGLSALAYNGYLYVMGGTDASLNYYDSVQFAQISSTGALSAPAQTGCSNSGTAWCYTTSFSLARDFFAASAYDGYIYISAGYNPATSGECLNGNGQTACQDVQYAPINSNGSIGNWQGNDNVNENPYTIMGEAGVVYNGYLYLLGGNTGTVLFEVDANQDVATASLQSTPQIGHYSLPSTISSSVNVSPYELLLSGTNTGNAGQGGINLQSGGISVRYAFADTTCTTLGTPNRLNTGNSDEIGTAFLTTVTAPACSSAAGLANYIWARFTLDDSFTFTFPDTSTYASNHTSVNGYTLYYHPSAGYRLRMGATFLNQTLQSLDAPP